MPVNFVPTGEDYIRFLPEILLTAFGTLIMTLEPFVKDKVRNLFGWFAFLALAASLAAAVIADSHRGAAFWGMLVIDGCATFFRVLVIAAALLTLLCCSQELI